MAAHTHDIFRNDTMLASLCTLLDWTTYATLASGVKPVYTAPPPSQQQQPQAQPTKFPPVNCGECGSTKRVHGCLHCVSLMCGGSHLRSHLAEHGHRFAIDLVSKHLFCSVCDDYVYNADADKLIWQYMRKLYDKISSIKLCTPPGSDMLWRSDEGQPPIKRARFPLVRSEDRRREHESIRNNGTIVKCTRLRGLFNLGSTCFMNTTLQAILHNPMMRSFFLSDGHNPKACKRGSETSAQTPQGPCLACSLDSLFMEAYSGEHAPFAPHKFLHSVWSYSNELAGYEQQDAHEFFITLLNGLHTHLLGTPSDCQCVIHKVFKGNLKSDVTCLSCGHVSSARDPFFDISVDLSLKKHAPADTAEDTLMGCLRRFTHPERLGMGDVRCGHCGSNQASTKQLSIWKAPCVLTIHLKRFEHTLTGASNSAKIDTFCSFPTKLNLAPFMSANLGSTASVPEGVVPNILALGHEYSLFAVITHVGTMETGHYVVYVLANEEWFKIDDDKVTKVHTSEVVQTKAYMLFYNKDQLDYMHRLTSAELGQVQSGKK